MTVSSIETTTAPLDWRAISPVSRVTVWLPHWKVLVTLLKMLMACSFVASGAIGAAPGPETRASGRNAIPRVLDARPAPEHRWNDTASPAGRSLQEIREA